MASTSKRSATRTKRKTRPLAFPVEFRLRIVKLFLEEGYSPKLLVEQFGISTHSIQRWVKAYRLHGAAGLEPKRCGDIHFVCLIITLRQFETS
jgi:transposase-like protein